MWDNVLGAELARDAAYIEQLEAENEQLKADRDSWIEQCEDARNEWLRLDDENKRLRELMQEFVNRCEAGEIRSRRTYAKFKEALNQ